MKGVIPSNSNVSLHSRTNPTTNPARKVVDSCSNTDNFTPMPSRMFSMSLQDNKKYKQKLFPLDSNSKLGLQWTRQWIPSLITALESDSRDPSIARKNMQSAPSPAPLALGAEFSSKRGGGGGPTTYSGAICIAKSSLKGGGGGPHPSWICPWRYTTALYYRSCVYSNSTPFLPQS